MGVTFRDESNEPSSIMIGYNDATVTTPTHPQLYSQMPHQLQCHSCGGGFVIILYLIPLISGQSTEKFL